MLKKKKVIRSIWDNKGKTIDRYTIILTIKKANDGYCCFSLSNNSDNGFFQFGTCKEGEHLGKRISWKDLPNNIRKHIINRLS